MNAHDKGVLTTVARCFRQKTQFMEPGMRKAWERIFQDFKHKQDKEFLQLLETPPLPPTSPAYKKIRCIYNEKGTCYLGDSCTFSHDPRAPLSLAEGTNEDWWRNKPLVMTQNQKSMGHGVYGVTHGDARAQPSNVGWVAPPPQPGAGVPIAPPSATSLRDAVSAAAAGSGIPLAHNP